MARFVAVIISLLFFVSCVSGRVFADTDHKGKSENAPSIRIPNVITSDGAAKKVSVKLAFWTNEAFADIMDQIAIHAGDGKFRFVHSMLFADEAPPIMNNDEFRCKIAYDLIPQFINEGYRARIVSQKKCSRDIWDRCVPYYDECAILIDWGDNNTSFDRMCSYWRAIFE